MSDNKFEFELIWNFDYEFQFGECPPDKVSVDIYNDNATKFELSANGSLLVDFLERNSSKYFDNYCVDIIEQVFGALLCLDPYTSQKEDYIGNFDYPAKNYVVCAYFYCHF